MNGQTQTPLNLARRLVYTVNLYQSHLARHLKEHNIGSSEYPVLIYLVNREATPELKISQSDIAQQQHRDPALITRAARSLAAKGLIVVSSDPDNRARNVLKLTPAGRDVAVEVEKLVRDWEEQAQSDLDETERTQLDDLLARLTFPQ